MGIQIEKRPGHDWLVTYRWEDGEPETMSVFGVMTIEEAIEEARFSLSPIGDDPEWPGYEILAIVRT